MEASQNGQRPVPPLENRTSPELAEAVSDLAYSHPPPHLPVAPLCPGPKALAAFLGPSVPSAHGQDPLLEVPQRQPLSLCSLIQVPREENLIALTHFFKPKCHRGHCLAFGLATVGSGDTSGARSHFQSDMREIGRKIR